MLTCIPKSLCSRDYQVSGLSSGTALLAFNFIGEKGSISLGEQEYTVQKHGMFSGRWTLEREGETYGDAQKPSAMFRSFEITAGDLQLTLRAKTPFTRCFDIFSGDALAGTIQPVHPFTRRAFIECTAPIPELIQLFAFWLVATLWERGSSSTSATT